MRLITYKHTGVVFVPGVWGLIYCDIFCIEKNENGNINRENHQTEDLSVIENLHSG